MQDLIKEREKVRCDDAFGSYVNKARRFRTQLDLQQDGQEPHFMAVTLRRKKRMFDGDLVLSTL